MYFREAAFYVVLLSGALSLVAQEGTPAIAGVYNEGSIGLPMVVAPGSAVVMYMFGSPVGPAEAVVSAAYPLRTSLAGVSARVIVGGEAVDLWIVGVQARWIRAVLPSRTPLGVGSLTVTRNGVVSAVYRLQIVERHFGLYDGTWCAPSAFEVPNPFCVHRAVQNTDESGRTTVNSLLGPARPKQIVTLWGTGLGASPGDESAGPVVKNLEVPGLSVFVGGAPAQVYYAGRSGCCAGVDEIIFEVPEGIQGCNVPVFVRYAENGLSSNDAFVSIASGEGACSDEGGLTEPEIRKLVNGELTVAQIFVSDPAGQWGAFFGRASKTYAIPFDTCRTYTWGLPFAAADVASGSYMDAGEALQLSREGATLVAVRDANQVYSGTFEGQLSGTYTLTNRTAGAAIPRFQAPLSVPARTFEWTNREQVDVLKRGDDLKLNWSGAGFGAGYVLVGGLFGVDGESSGGFLCRARYEDEGFTVPAAVLDRYRAAFPYTTELGLFVSPALVQRLSISGIDVAEYLQTSVMQTKTLKLE